MTWTIFPRPAFESIAAYSMVNLNDGASGETGTPGGNHGVFNCSYPITYDACLQIFIDLPWQFGKKTCWSFFGTSSFMMVLNDRCVMVAVVVHNCCIELMRRKRLGLFSLRSHGKNLPRHDKRDEFSPWFLCKTVIYTHLKKKIIENHQISSNTINIPGFLEEWWLGTG